nr:response regulator [Stenotrophomonas mori]
MIVDDHADIRDPLAAYLRRFEFDVETVADGTGLRHCLQQHGFDLILLDIMLPGEGGLSLCRHIAEHHGTPVILLTAVTEQADRIAGLEVGADDYVAKPFDPRELVARIRSVLRRARREAVPAPAAAATEHAFRFDDWTLNVTSRELRNPAGEPISLSTTEFHLLRVLAENPNRVLTRSQLLDLTQRGEAATFDRSIDTQVSRLRRKLEVDARNPLMIKTIRGDGYLFTARVEAGPR